MPDESDCNLNIPLWKVIRASTAAPIYFPPEEIELRKDENFSFVDGGMTPYNTPALLAFFVATLPYYHLEWRSGTENLLIVSIGTGRIRSTMHSSLFSSNIGSNLIHAPSGLMENISLQQDLLCRIFGHCLFGEVIDTEVGTLVGEPAEGKKFDYVRYDHRFPDEEIKTINLAYGGLSLSNLRTVDYMCALGKTYAHDNIKIDHLI